LFDEAVVYNTQAKCRHTDVRDDITGSNPILRTASRKFSARSLLASQDNSIGAKNGDATGMETLPRMDNLTSAAGPPLAVPG
jgi:hypothetical protein